MTIPLSSVDEGDRSRIEYGDLSGIWESHSRVGSIHPMVLSRNQDGTFRLVAGGRRFRMAKTHGVTELHHGSILEPGKIGFLFKDEVPEDELKEAELDENLYRLKMKWHEEVVNIADIHKLKRDKEGHKWGVRQTAEIMGSGYGRTSVSYAVRLAKLIRAGDKEILDSPTMSDAVAVLVKRKEDEALAELHKRTLPSVAATSSGTDISSLFGSINLGGSQVTERGDANETTQSTGSLVAPTPSFNPSVSGEKARIPLSSMFRLGDFRDLAKLYPDSSFDHIVTDIPYGIDPDMMDTMKNIGDVSAEHQVDQNVSFMEPFLRQAFRLVRSGGFCVFFYDLDWHEYLQSTAEAVGWKVQRWPLIAHKTSACQNNAAQFNFTKNYECAMVLRRDEKTVLRSQQPTSLWMGDFAAERRLYNNPFAKPFELWKWIYTAISFPGQTVLDTFCGEMSASRAAVNCGLHPFGWEIKEQHFNRGLQHMQAAYALLHKSNVEFV